MKAAILSFRRPPAEPPKPDPRNGSCIIVSDEDDGTFTAYHRTVSESSLGWPRGPFGSRKEALAAAQRLAAELGCEVAI